MKFEPEKLYKWSTCILGWTRLGRNTVVEEASGEDQEWIFDVISVSC